MNLKKTIIIVAFLLIVVIIGFSLYLQSKFESSVPQRSGTIHIAYLDAPVTIVFDSMGIPQIWAKTAHDAWFGLGWMHAADRLFQIDLSRRVSQGRLAELFGPDVLEIDRLQRKIGHLRLATEAQEKLSDKSRNLLAAYTAGVNSYVGQMKNLPFEYTLLGMDFEPWEIRDCLSLFSFQTWFSDVIQNNSELFYSMTDLDSSDNLKDILTDSMIGLPTTVPNTDPTWYSRFDPKNSMLRQLLSEGLLPFAMSLASNSWAVMPQKSASGKAMLASDPHLQVSRLPQFWYIAGLHSTEEKIDAVGITTPGLPVMVFGHNGHAAWAFTAGGIDVTDQYIEKINPQDTTQYLTISGWQKFEIHEEVIHINGAGQSDTLKVKISRHGPVLGYNDSLHHAYTFRWVGYDVSLEQSVDNAFQMVKVTNFPDFRKLVTGLGALNANWMYADILGNIGYQLGTPIPIRTIHHASTPLKGWTDEQEWLGYQALENTPHAYNPERGWLATCNNLPAGEHLGYELYGNFADDRIRRIEKLLHPARTVSFSDMQRFQLDVQSEYILRWKEPVMEILKELDEDEWFNRVAEWDGSYTLNSQSAALMDTWLWYLREMIFRDDFGNLTDEIHLQVFFRDRFLYRLYQSGNSHLFDDKTTPDVTESRDDIARKAMKKTLNIISGKSWGQIQFLTLAHPMSQVPVLSGLLGLENGPFSRAGNPGTLNVANAIKNRDGIFEVISGPSWRFIIDFADVDGVQMVIPSGQSGNPMDDHFFDFYPLWASGNYWNVPLSKAAVINNKVSILELLPGNLP